MVMDMNDGGVDEIQEAFRAAERESDSERRFDSWVSGAADRGSDGDRRVETQGRPARFLRVCDGENCPATF